MRHHKLFVRQGYDILCDYPISFVQAALGAEVQVPTVDGKVSYHIPEGTQPNTVFRLRGKGVPKLNSNQRGDQYVTIKVEIPKGLNEKQKDLLRHFDENVDASKYKQSKNFFEKMREIFKEIIKHTQNAGGIVRRFRRVSDPIPILSVRIANIGLSTNTEG